MSAKHSVLSAKLGNRDAGALAGRPLNAQRSTLKAFTLIEMLVLIIIIAVLTSVAVPAYARFHARAKFQQSVQETVSLLAWARDQAIQNGADSVIRFDPQTETFQVTVETPGADADRPSAVQESQEAGAPAAPRTLNLGDEVAIPDFTVYGAQQSMAASPDNTRRELRFHDDGRSNGAQFVMVRPGDSYAVLIDISPAAGRITTRNPNEVR